MKRITTFAAAALMALGLTFGANPAAAKDMGWIHEVSLVGKTVTLGPASGKDGKVYQITDKTLINGPEGPMALSELPSMKGGSMPDTTNVVFESAPGGTGTVLYELQLMPRMDY